jgi:hypothetical protein
MPLASDNGTPFRFDDRAFSVDPNAWSAGDPWEKRFTSSTYEDRDRAMEDYLTRQTRLTNIQAQTLLGGTLTQDGTYRDLDQTGTPTPISISLTTGTSALLTVSIATVNYDQTTGDARTTMSYEISGATTRSTASVGVKSIIGHSGGAASPLGTYWAYGGFSDVATGLTPGFNTFTIKFLQQVGLAGTAFDLVTLVGIPLQ